MDIEPKIGDKRFRNCHYEIYQPCPKCGKPHWMRTNAKLIPLYPLCFSCARKHPPSELNKEHKRIAQLKAMADPIKGQRIQKGLNSRWIHEDSAEKQRQAMLNKWSDPIYKENTMIAIYKGLDMHPNTPESIILSTLNMFFPYEWRYVGNGELVLDGKNPDFEHIEKKWLIEHFGEFHHSNRNKHLLKHQTYEGRMNFLIKTFLNFVGYLF